jgi:hypothetical protein
MPFLQDNARAAVRSCTWQTTSAVIDSMQQVKESLFWVVAGDNNATTQYQLLVATRLLL